MGKYLLKRILWSIFSIVCVMIIMIILLFQLKDRATVVTATADPTVMSKKRGNDKDYYISQLLEKYDYIEMEEYSSYINAKYSKTLLPNDLQRALTIPELCNPSSASDEDSEDVQFARQYIKEFADYYSARGYEIVYLESQYTSDGKIAEGCDPYVYATKNQNIFVRVWNFFADLIQVETTNDIANTCEENGMVLETGYYLVCDNNEWESFSNYWGCFDYELTVSSKYTDYESNEVGYALKMGVFDTDLVDEDGNAKSFTWNIVYYDATTKTATRIMDDATQEANAITESAEYTFVVYANYDENNNITYTCKAVQGRTAAKTVITKGSVYPIESTGISLIWDEYSNMPALVGSGTTHKYLVYFDDVFPYIHQNIIKLNLGTSIATETKGKETLALMFSNIGQGSIVAKSQEYPSQIGTGNYVDTADNFHTATYYTGYEKTIDSTAYANYGSRYFRVSSYYSDMARVGYSFLIGILSTIFSYFLGIPLGILMARKKDKIADKIGMAYIIFMIAVPSLAYIFMFSSIGQAMGLPVKFAMASDPAWLVYILPIVSLTLPSIAGEMKWVRRYMIDQENSDYVKFARSQGLSEGEIFTKHISKNAIIPIVHGIPGAIIGCLSGAFITEKVYGIPGTGGFLVQSINGNDNTMILGLTFFYAILSIVSLILGDLLLTVVDPRISFTGGRK